VGGLTGGLGIEATLKAFNGGLGGGATVALSYALLGAFAVAIAKSGLAHALADKALAMVDRQDASGGSQVKWLLIGLLWVVAIASQNILPIHIAFIPLLVPPLLYVLTKLQLDRRLIACVMTFGLITPYMFLPVGFGNIFLNEILLANVARAAWTSAGSMSPTPWAFRRWAWWSACWWRCLSAIARSASTTWQNRAGRAGGGAVQPADLLVAGVAIAAAFIMQLWLDSMIIGALVGFLIFSVSGIVAGATPTTCSPKA
jgi:predicted histidine transporter YuiF (NhaC family)